MAPTSTELRRARALMLALAAVAWLAGAAPAAHAQPAAARAVEQGRAEVVDYWTEERIAEALPAEQLLDGVRAPNGLLDDLLGGGEPTPARGTVRRIDDPRKAPFRTHGKVYFTLGGVNYVCSGTVVEAETRRLVVTAGHCVHGEGQFASNFMFVPAKDGAAEPFGTWTARSLATTPQWRTAEDIRFDVGMATMRKRNGKRIQKVVGARGIAFNQGRDLRFGIFGYPAEPPFGGSALYRCSSPAQGTDSGPSPRPTRIDCDMTGGSSGGGWVIRRGRVNGVVSYGYECLIADIICEILGGNPEEGKLFGPYFGNTIRKLYRSQARR